MGLKKYAQVISVLVIIATVYYSFYGLTPTEKKAAITQKTEFSITNALTHLKEITKKPHFTGSPEHKVVRDYIVSELEKLGLQVEIPAQIAVNKKWRAATNTKNILARIKGSETGKALLLLSHYDSNPHSSLGASDAGSGVVVILEGIRAFLAQHKQPKNDIIICISDAEELGLLGANAFVNHHRWAKDVGLVLNFEARGSGGPSYLLLETTGGNKKLIEAFQHADTPYPVGNSLMYSIYKMLPNDTDLTVFREDGNIEGYNFAFIGDHFDYHTAQDSYERMDIKSLKHQASYLVATLDYFSMNKLDDLKAEGDYVYFNFPYVGLVFYPFSWAVPMFIACVVFFLGLLVVGISKKKLTIQGILKGFVPFLLSLVSTSIIAIFGWKLLLKIHPQYHDILHGFTYNGYYYIAAFTVITLAICCWFYSGFFNKRTNQDLLIAPLFFWLLISGGAAFYLKGAAFFILPVIMLLLVLSILIFLKNSKNTLFIFTFLSIPAILIFAPLVKMFPVGLGLKMLVISTVFTVLLFGLLVPVFQQYKKLKRMANALLIFGIFMMIIATIFAGYSDTRKQPNSMLYVFDATKNEAYWASYNSEIDEFTKQFLGENPTKGNFDKNTIASKYKTSIKLYAKAEIFNFEKPIIQLVLDTIINNNRKIHLHIVSVRNAHKIEVLSKMPIKFKSIKVNGEGVKNKSASDYVLSIHHGTILSYFITEENEAIDLEFIVDKNQQFDIDILEAKYDLFTNPQFKSTPRSSIMMPMPFVLNDASIIKTSIKF
ncbi:MAG: M28 family peptidase [Lutibacter sp.]|nr:M28 family peptidase [Lutibacter sp.]